MIIDKELLKILVCPETHIALSLADGALVAELNRRIVAGELKNRAGELVSAQINGALLRAGNTVAYPIRDGIPVLLIDEAIAL